MNSDPLVMEFMPRALTQVESDALADRIEAAFRRHGFGLYAVEVKSTGEFAGYVGLSIPRFEAHFTPCVEVGWRLAAEFWGSGFATEGARAVVRHAGSHLGLKTLVSFTSVLNARSRRIMEKLGMTHDEADDFDHPELTQGHPLRRHVLYRLSLQP